MGISVDQRIQRACALPRNHDVLSDVSMDIAAQR